MSRRGRAACSNLSGRYEKQQKEPFDDGWNSLAEDPATRQVKTRVHRESPRHALSRNQSPDIPFDQSVNPYRGCEHGCIYCYARPTHSYMGLSPGMDFETELFAKDALAETLEKELANPRYRVSPIALGTNTDPYQPIERDEGNTRSILELMDRTSHPVSIVTKSSLILRDKDILQRLAGRQLVKVGISVTTLDASLARKMEPRAPAPRRRLETIRALQEAAIPTMAMIAPVVPGLTDHELEQLVMAVAEAGADSASYLVLRLPLEVKTLFCEWLEAHFPDRKKRVLARIAAIRGGQLNDPRFGSRMRGEGVEADLLRARFAAALRRSGLASRRSMPLRTDLFQAKDLSRQQELFP